MRLAGLSVAGEGDVGKGLFVAEVLERRDHVGLEVVPSQAELLLVAGRHLVSVAELEVVESLGIPRCVEYNTKRCLRLS